MKIERDEKNLYIKVDKKAQDIIRKVIKKLELEDNHAVKSDSVFVNDDCESKYLS